MVKRGLLLVHAPLLGPFSWHPCAYVLAAMGYPVAVPDLRPAISVATGWWRRAVDICCEVIGSRTGRRVKIARRSRVAASTTARHTNGVVTTRPITR